ncbi:hypothetical protein BJX64DRAFT_52121 [Aspergillus heterothallicus]
MVVELWLLGPFLLLLFCLLESRESHIAESHPDFLPSLFSILQTRFDLGSWVGWAHKDTELLGLVEHSGMAWADMAWLLDALAWACGDELPSLMDRIVCRLMKDMTSSADCRCRCRCSKPVMPPCSLSAGTMSRFNRPIPPNPAAQVSSVYSGPHIYVAASRVGGVNSRFSNLTS